jgi:hypothetical protein
MQNVDSPVFDADNHCYRSLQGLPGTPDEVGVAKFMGPNASRVDEREATA